MRYPAGLPIEPYPSHRMPHRYPGHLVRVVLCLVVIWLSTTGSIALAQTSSRQVAGDARWAILSGSTFRATVKGWGRAAGWDLEWDVSIDYQFHGSAVIDGTFERATSEAFEILHSVSPDLRMTLYRGDRIVHIYQAGPEP